MPRSIRNSCAAFTASTGRTDMSCHVSSRDGPGHTMLHSVDTHHHVSPCRALGREPLCPAIVVEPEQINGSRRDLEPDKFKSEIARAELCNVSAGVSAHSLSSAKQTLSNR